MNQIHRPPSNGEPLRNMKNLKVDTIQYSFLLFFLNCSDSDNWYFLFLFFFLFGFSSQGFSLALEHIL